MTPTIDPKPTGTASVPLSSNEPSQHPHTEHMTTRIAVIGAGGGGAAATYALGRALPSAEITVFEKSRGVCGRAAARRRDGVVYEYGANYLEDTGGRVSELITSRLRDGLVEVDGPVWTFDAEGVVS